MQKALPAAPREIISSIQEFFKTGLADSVSSMLGESVEVASVENVSQQPSLWFRSEFGSSSEGYIAFGAPKELWLGIGSQILGMSESEDVDSELVLSTLKEVSAQVTGSITSSLNYKYQRQLQAKEAQVSEAAHLSESELQKFFFNLSAGNSGTSIPVTLVFSASLVETLTPTKVRDEIAAPQELDKKLELLMDVEMPVTVSIGRAHLPLKDVIKLTTGSVVELSRSISEPVDIVVNNTLVARGDVVVVDGNFGVRIREVLSKEDRIKRFASR